MDSLQLKAPDGADISLYRWQPAGAPRGVLLISHGLSEHGQRYDRMARELCLAGFVVYALDHPGHGPRAEVPGFFAERDGWRRVLDRLDVVRRHLDDTHPGLPLTLFGHSMGSFVARCYFLQHGEGLAALVLSATGYRQGVLARVMRRVAMAWGGLVGRQVPSRFLARLIFGGFNLTFWPKRTAADWLSRDADEVDRYLADPLCAAFPTAGLWVDLFGGVVAMERSEKHAPDLASACPVLLLAGSRDPVSLGYFGLNQLAARYRAAGLSQVEVRVYRGGRHEMHNEINRDAVIRDLVLWLEGRGALLPVPLAVVAQPTF
ncbi:alpha/beta fold hydrolase [Paludibacterium purpuratum]|uniref:Alpha-beta hydrolase superfamily lysophospholipase n=1 Tax=Paludibacterium purpuratum TaxID=1144873 RepID=A0A4R7B6R5_9NEIS|nr:alpha/beta hydrolase [Paludibacterium purpuratum]TDR80371.1 alpha-beta hydrolase superfamily lysophospholipase [Paludibacterium purpuratum]